MLNLSSVSHWDLSLLIDFLRFMGHVFLIPCMPSNFYEFLNILNVCWLLSFKKYFWTLFCNAVKPHLLYSFWGLLLNCAFSRRKFDLTTDYGSWELYPLPSLLGSLTKLAIGTETLPNLLWAVEIVLSVSLWCFFPHRW